MPKAGGMRVLVVGLSWPPETFIARLLEGLASSGIKVTIAHDRRPEERWAADGRLRWLPTPAWRGFVPKRLLMFGWMLLWASVRSPKDVTKFARRAKVNGGFQGLETLSRLIPFAGRRWDVIYFPWNSASIAYLPLFDLGCPAVVSCRGAHVNVAPFNPKRSVIRKGLRQTFSRAAAVHCVSEAILNEATQYGLNKTKAKVIHPAVSPDVFCPDPTRTPSQSRAFRVITTGALHWRKGYEYSLLAIRQLMLSGIDVVFDIVGDGPEGQRLSFTIDDLGLAENVRLHGRLAPEEVRARLQGADVFLLSSLSEGISNAVLEAMACGLPVVTSDCGGMREAVSDGEEGFVVPTRDPKATSEALKKLYEDPALRTQMGQAGRARVLRDFNLTQQVEQFIELFAGVTEPV